MEKKEEKRQIIFTSHLPVKEKEKYFKVETVIPFHDYNKVTESIDLAQKVTNETNKLIENKKLQFNDIWTNKITQEDLYTPKPFIDQNATLALNKILFASIMKYVSKIDCLFLLFSQEKDMNKMVDYSNNILLISTSLQMKIRSFLQVKCSMFKIDSTQLIPLNKIIQWFKSIQTQIQKETSSQIKGILSTLNEFYSILSNIS